MGNIPFDRLRASKIGNGKAEGNPSASLRARKRKTCPENGRLAQQTKGWEIGNGKIGKRKAYSIKHTAYGIRLKADSLKRKASIPKWDGHAAERIVETIAGEQ